MRIIISTGAASGREFEVTRQMTVGRSPSCDIHLPDQGISSRHAVVRPIAGGIEVADLDSTNGTFVNDSEVRSPRAVYRGDIVRFSRIAASVSEGVIREAATAPRRLDNGPLPAPVVVPAAKRKPQAALIAAGVGAVVLVAAAFGLGQGFHRETIIHADSVTATPIAPTATPAPVFTPTSVPTQPPAPNPTQPPAPNPTQPPAPNPTKPPSPGNATQILIQKLTSGTITLPAGTTHPESFSPTDDEVASNVVADLGAEFLMPDGGGQDTYWTVYATAADAKREFDAGASPLVNSGDPNVRMRCGAGKNGAGKAVAFCNALRTGSQVLVQGVVRPASGTPDSSLALTYTKAGLQYLATMER